MSLDILIVDDEKDIRDLISDILVDEGYTPRTANNSISAFSALSEKIPAAIVLDIWLKDSELDGLGILEVAQRKYPTVPVIMISGHANIETAITSLRMGAYDFIEKPFKQDRLIHTLKRAIEVAALKAENIELKLRYGKPDLLIGNSSNINQLRQSIERVAPTGSRIFITGPAGAGKETISRIIHEKSHRRSAPFIAVNAASLSHDRADHELFGTEDNSDINSAPRKIGTFEQAHEGTLFIDEITDLPLSTQGKFVRFLQDKSFERVNGLKRIEADVRVIAATHKDPMAEIKAGRLREDLFYRINVVPLKAPYLKERREDIPLLCEYFLAHAAETSCLPVRKLSEETIAAMQVYDWPGNVRQLRNVIEWLLIMHPGDTDKEITSSMLPNEIFAKTPSAITPEFNTDIMSMQLRKAREVFEKQYLTAQINRFGGNISRAACFIGMERSALHRKLRTLEIHNDNKIVGG